MLTSVVVKKKYLPQNFKRLAFVVSEFNAEIVSGLLKGGENLLTELGFKPDQWRVFRVPGAFEIPLVAQKLAASGEYSGIVALGCVIQGETRHFDFVSFAATYGLMQASLNTGVNIGFGVITVDNLTQAQVRSEDNAFNKGREATLAVLDVAQTLSTI